MKIGIDVHGVLDTFSYFKEMAKLFVAAGHEVHIITGVQWRKRVKDKFKKLGIEKGIHFTHFVSITDLLIEQGKKVRWEDADNPWFNKKDWNEAKAQYCFENGLDIHFDDRPEYASSFKSPIFIAK